MFDMNKIGLTIARRRKELNLTQVELADKLLVSYQAVSGWERGLSMPDVSNLPLLAEALELSLDELLGQKDAAVVQKLQQDEPLPEEELIEAAPFIKPEAFEEQVEGRSFSGNSLVMMAPFLSSDKLFELISEGPIKPKKLIKLAPFLSNEHLEQLLVGSDGEVGSGTLIALAPFLSAETLGRLARSEDTSSGSLIALAPFMSSTDLGALVREKAEQGTLDKGILMALAPFLDQNVLMESLRRKPKKKPEPDDVIVVEEDDLAQEVSKLEAMLEKLKRKMR